MKTRTDRTAAAKKAWETMRARKAAGLPPLSASKPAAKPEREYSALIGAWLAAAPVVAAGPEQLPAAAPPAKKRRAAKRRTAAPKRSARTGRKKAA